LIPASTSAGDNAIIFSFAISVFVGTGV